ncbi:MAG: Molybdopterin-guanine dinucleotide biosynthesis protein [Firmicutes bacterium]|nr:Molybdopterin-guanine dinucleotide biosynthesis protein [Bacillota bacterium]
MIAELTGIILAGGLSTRMGRDKASLPWDGTDLLHTALNVLAPVCSQLIVVSNVERNILVPGVWVVHDLFRGCGPLGGIHAGISASRTEWNFVAACDMPCLNGQVVEYMAKNRKEYDVLVPFIANHYHPLHAMYHKRCLPRIRALLEQGNYRMTALFATLNVGLMEERELALFDESYAMLSNLNSPTDIKNLLNNLE